MVRHRRFACLFPVLVFIALRALSHAHPTPLPWTSGIFDVQGLDDILQAIRIAYTPSPDVRYLPTEVLAIPTGGVSVAEPAPVRGTFLAAVHSRAPPSR